MELQEAIEHARQVSEHCSADNRDCAYQHDKLADWLEELKQYQSIGTLDHFRELAQAEKNEPLRCTGCFYLEENCAPCAHCIRAAGYADYYHRKPEEGKT